MGAEVKNSIHNGTVHLCEAISQLTTPSGNDYDNRQRNNDIQDMIQFEKMRKQRFESERESFNVAQIQNDVEEMKKNHQNQIDGFQEEIDELDQQNQRLNQKSKNLESESEIAAKHIVKLQNLLSENIPIIKDMENKSVTTDLNLDELIHNSEDLSINLKKSDNKINNLESEIEELKQENQKKEEDLKHYIAKLETKLIEQKLTYQNKGVDEKDNLRKRNEGLTRVNRLLECEVERLRKSQVDSSIVVKPPSRNLMEPAPINKVEVGIPVGVATDDLTAKKEDDGVVSSLHTLLKETRSVSTETVPLSSSQVPQLNLNFIKKDQPQAPLHPKPIYNHQNLRMDHLNIPGNEDKDRGDESSSNENNYDPNQGACQDQKENKRIYLNYGLGSKDREFDKVVFDSFSRSENSFNINDDPSESVILDSLEDSKENFLNL